MSNTVCLVGPAFSISGSTVFNNQQVSFQIVFNSTAEEAEVLIYQWYLNGELVPGETEKNFIAKIASGSHIIAARILSSGGWSGLKQHSFETTNVTVTPLEVIWGRTTVAEGSAATYRVLALLADGTIQDVTSGYKFSTPDGGKFSGSTLYINSNTTHGDDRPVTITAKKTGATTLNRIISVKDTTPVKLVSTAINGPLTITEGSSAAYQVVATNSDGSITDVTRQYKFFTPRGAFDGSTLTIYPNTTHGDPQGITITAKKKGVAPLTLDIGITDATVATLVSTTLTGASSIQEGTSENYVVIAAFSDGTTQDVTAQYTFKTKEGTFNGSTLTLGTNSIHGDLRVLTITAERTGFETLTKDIKVTDATVQTLAYYAIDGPLSVDEGSSTPYNVFATFSNGAKQDVTAQYNFSTTGGTFSGSTLIIPSNTKHFDSYKIRITASGPEGLPAITQTVTVADTTPVVEISSMLSGASVIAEGSSETYRVIATFSNGTTKDVSSDYNFTATKGSFVGSTLTIDSNRSHYDSHTITITAAKEGYPSHTRDIFIADATPVTIVSTMLEGPDFVSEGSTTPYKILATLSNGTIQNITLQYTFTALGGTFTGANLVVASNSMQNDIGQVFITATREDSTSLTKTVKITDATPITVVSTALTGADILNEGEFETYSIIALLSDGSTKDITDDYSFSASGGILNGSTLSIEENSTIGDGGIIQITATHNESTTSFTKDVTITDTTAVVVSSSILNGSDTITKGTSETYQIIASFSDGSTQDVTSEYQFATSQGTFAGATLSLEANAIDSGNIIISATKGNSVLSKTVDITDIPPAKLVLSVLKGADMVVEGTSETYHVWATSNGVTQDVTSEYTFTATKGTFAGATLSIDANTIQNDEGTTTITAANKAGGITLSKTVKIKDGTAVLVVSTELNGPDSISEGTSAPFQIIATLSNGTTKNLTAQYQFTTTHGKFRGSTLTIDANTTHYDDSRLVVSAKNIVTPSLPTLTKELPIVDTTPLTVISTTLSGADIISEGAFETYKILASLSNGTIRDVTADYEFETSAGTLNGPTLTIDANSVQGENETVLLSATKSGSPTLTKNILIKDTTPIVVSATELNGSDTITIGTSETYQIIASLSNGITKDVTAEYTFTATQGVFAGATLNLDADAEDNGNITITATKGNSILSKTIDITDVPPATVILSSLKGKDVVFEGSSETYEVVEKSNGTTQDVTSEYTFTATQGTFAGATLSIDVNSVQNDERLTTITASKAGGISLSRTITIGDSTAVTMVSTILKGADTISEGISETFQVIASLSNGSTKNVTSEYQFTTTGGIFKGSTLIINPNTSHNDDDITITVTATHVSTATSLSKTLTVTDTTPITVLSTALNGPDTIIEGASAPFDVIATLSNGTTKNVSSEYEFSATEGTFNGRVLSINSNTGYDDGHPIVVTAKNIHSFKASKTVRIIDATPVTVVDEDISGPLYILEGDSANYQVLKWFSNGNIQDVSSDYMFAATEGAFLGATLSIPTNDGNNDTRPIDVSAIKNGTTIISTKVVITDTTPAKVISRSISGPSVINEGSAGTFQVLATLSNSTTQDITGQYFFSSPIGTFAGSTLIIDANSIQNDSEDITITATKSGSTPLTTLVSIEDKTPATVVSYDISGPEKINEGATATYKVLAILSNGKTQDVTNDYSLSTTVGTFTGTSLSIDVNNSDNAPTQLTITATKPGADSITKTVAIGDVTVIEIENFDFMSVRYAWESGSGSDLDIKVGYENTGTAFDNKYVGYGFFNTIPEKTKPAANAYLWWGVDNEDASGHEGVLIGIKAFLAALPAAPDVVEVALYAKWFGAVGSGNFNIEVKTYLGGSMSLSGSAFANTGGTEVSSNVRAIHLGKFDVPHKVAVLKYNKVTQTATIELL